MSHLEHKIAFHIISLITDPKDIGRLSMVSKHWNEIATDKTLWQNLFQFTFSTEWLSSDQKEVKTRVVLLTNFYRLTIGELFSLPKLLNPKTVALTRFQLSGNFGFCESAPIVFLE
jgi:hypothetical protein